MAILLNDVCHSAVIDFIFISCRILWIKFLSFQGLMFVWNFISGIGCVDHIFTLKQKDEKVREKKRRVYSDLMDLERHMTGLIGNHYEEC